MPTTVLHPAAPTWHLTRARIAVRSVPCQLCQAPADVPCQPSPSAGHLRRWIDGYTSTLISGEDIAEVATGRRIRCASLAELERRLQEANPGPRAGRSCPGWPGRAFGPSPPGKRR